MTRLPSRAPRRSLAAGVLAGALLLTGCGAGQDAQTYEPRANGDGDSVDGGVGAIAIRHVSVRAPQIGQEYAAGQDALVDLTIINSGTSEDALVGASSPEAASVDIAGAPVPLVIAPRSTAERGYNLVLRDLREELFTAEYVEITLEFREAGSVTLNVPVSITFEEPEEVEYEVPETDSEGNPLPQDESPAGDEEEGSEGVETGSGPDSAAGPEGDSSQG